MDYSEKQIEIENLLNSVGNGEAVPANIVAEILRMIEQKGKNINESVDESETELRLKILEEKDWRKRAQIAAMIISESLKK